MNGNGVKWLRPIRAQFYGLRSKLIKSTRGKHPRTMILAAVDHLQVGDYKDAIVAEVFDTDGAGTLHGVVKQVRIKGQEIPKIQIVYERDPKKFTEGGRHGKHASTSRKNKGKPHTGRKSQNGGARVPGESGRPAGARNGAQGAAHS